MTTGGSATAVYRHLLRSASHAVRHDRPACSNLRRLLRDDFEIALKAGTSEEQSIQQCGITMLLHLASSRSKEDSSPANLLAHQTVRNIASLCYHHLSPLTHMQPLSKKSKSGGTDTASLRRRRGSSGLKKAQSGASLAMSSFETGSASSASAVPVMDAQVLPSLVVLAKPIRGPIYTSYYRSFLPGRWDGQKTIKTLQTSSAFVNHLESMLEAANEEMEKAKKQHGKYSPQVLSQRAKLKQIKGEVKSAYKQRQKIEDRRNIQFEVANLLHSIVSKAQNNNGPWLGAHRFKKWATGVWLPP